MLTRRRFVTSVGIGAAGAVAAPGSPRAAVKTACGRCSKRLGADTGRGHGTAHHPVEQREPGRSRKNRARCHSGRVRPERRGARPLLECLRRAHRGAGQHHNVQTANIALGCGSTQILRNATACVHGAQQSARGHDSDLRGMRRLRRHAGQPGRAVPLDRISTRTSIASRMRHAARA